MKNLQKQIEKQIAKAKKQEESLDSKHTLSCSSKNDWEGDRKIYSKWNETCKVIDKLESALHTVKQYNLNY